MARQTLYGVAGPSISLIPSGARASRIALVIAGVKAIVALGVILYAGQEPMRAWFHVVARQRSSELFMLNVLLITLGLVCYLLFRVREVLFLLMLAILLATAIEPVVFRLRRGPFTRGTGVLLREGPGGHDILLGVLSPGQVVTDAGTSAGVSMSSL